MGRASSPKPQALEGWEFKIQNSKLRTSATAEKPPRRVRGVRAGRRRDGARASTRPTSARARNPGKAPRAHRTRGRCGPDRVVNDPNRGRGHPSLPYHEDYQGAGIVETLSQVAVSIRCFGPVEVSR